MRLHRPVLRIISLIGITAWLIACGGGGGGGTVNDAIRSYINNRATGIVVATATTATTTGN
jgi:hypothetical protein